MGEIANLKIGNIIYLQGMLQKYSQVRVFKFLRTWVLLKEGSLVSI
jgi:hypothetical protein